MITRKKIIHHRQGIKYKLRGFADLLFFTGIKLFMLRRRDPSTAVLFC